MLDPITKEMRELSFEFLRRVVNELKGRCFEFYASPLNGETIIAAARPDVILHVLPEMAREFAEQIKPEWTRCHKRNSLPQEFTAHDLRSGLQLRCMRHFDLNQNEILLRFDAGFS